jgi:uncharacterized protein
MIHINISAPVYPTEDPKKVIKAIMALFNDINIEKKTIEANELENKVSPSFILTGEGGLGLLSTLHRLIRKEEIIDSVRDKVFSKGMSNDRLSVCFLLNKQAAFVGIPSVPAQEEPLGSIEVVIRAGSTREIEKLIEWLLPLTEEGKPIVEVEMESVEKD